MVKKQTIEVPYSRVKFEVAKILAQEGYVHSVERAGTVPSAVIRIGIKYQNGSAAITGIKRVSRPGLRWYVGTREIPAVVGGMGIAILSTPQGIMTGKDAKKKGIGGELLCTVW